MRETQASAKRRFGVLALILAVALGIAGVFVGGSAAFADSSFTTTPQPSLTGGGQVGDPITADLSGWSPTPDSFSYQWLSGGAPISGESGTSTDGSGVEYTPTTADIGNLIDLSVTASKAGYTDTIETTDNADDIGPIGEATVTTDTPTISGSVTDGQTLTANPGNWGPGTVSFSYQWFRDGQYISDGTSATYVTVPRDSGQQLSVAVTGSETGYQSATVNASSVGPISGTGLTVSGTITGYPVGGGSTVGPLQGIVVEVFQGAGSYVGYGYTDDNGHYSIPFGAGSSTDGYTVRFNQPVIQGSPGLYTSYVYEFLGGTVDQDAATTFSLTSGSPSYVANDQLALGATISGVVKDPNGSPIDGAYVSADPVGQYNGPTANTAADGSYMLQQVAATDTVVTSNASPQFPNGNQDAVYYDQQWWNHASSAAAATPLSITAGGSTTGINFDLTFESTITGQVVDASGVGIPYIDVMPWHYDVANNDYVTSPDGPIETDANGYFTVAANGYQGYKFQFSDSLGAVGFETVSRTTPFDTEFFGGTGTLASATAETFTGDGDHIDLGAITMTPHSGGPAWSGTPVIDPVDGEASTYEIDGAEPTPGTATYTTQWYRDGTVAIPGATDLDYTLTSADTGHVITATLTASLSGYANVSVTTSNAIDLRQNFVVSTPPTITGTTQVGNTLSVSGGVYNPTPDTTSYQWYRQAGTNTPVAISGATSSSYALTGADAGDTISVSIKLQKAGYHTHTFSMATTTTITPGILSTATPTISGTLVNGSTLTANTSAWGPGTVALAYQWFDGSAPISGATLSTYTLATPDIGSQIQVQVTGTETGYTTVTLTSSQTAVVVGMPMTPATPTITDTAHPSAPTFGDPLTASVTGWAPSGTSFAYQWLRNTVPITNATTSSYSVAAADIGSTLSVTVTGTRSGYATTSSTSAQTATVVGAPFVENSPPTIGNPSSGANEYTVTNGSWSPAPTTTTYQWYANNVAISGATNDTYVPVPQDAGKSLTATVSVQASGYLATGATATAAVAVTSRFSSEPAPTIMGTAQVGDTLQAAAGTWTPAPSSTEFTWVSYGATGSCSSGYTAIQGATGQTYTVAASLAGDNICVRQTGDLANFRSDTVSSLATGTVAKGALTTVPPTISDATNPSAPTFGDTLTASPGTWTPSGETFTYQWSRTNGTTTMAIPGATSSSYALQTADVGDTVTVAVSGSLSGYLTANATSAPTPTIVAEAFALSPAPILSPLPISGGETLTASTGTWSPAATFTYQWLSNGQPIQSQTGKTFTVTNTNAGNTIAVEVTGRFPGYTPTTEESDGTIPTESWTASPTPTITGSAKVGETLTANAGTWTGPANANDIAYSYVWTYGTTAEAPTSPSSLATNDWSVTPAAYGHTVTVTVYAYADGFPVTPRVSSRTSTVAVGPLTTVVPTITGTLAVGNTLTANPGGWSPANTTFKYEWYRGSSSISGATASTYTLSGSDYGQKIKVKVTGSASDYVSASSTSAATTDIAAGTITYTQPTIVGSATYGTTLSINKGTWTPTSLTYKYQWYRDGVAISGATSSTYTIGSSSIGHVLTVKVSASKTGYTSVPTITGSTTSAPTATITDGVFANAPTPTVTGTLAVGSTLTASHGTSSPSTSVTHTYQWYSQVSGAGAEAIPGATSSTYKLAAGDAGKVISLELTYNLKYYYSASVTSTPTTEIWVTATPTITGTAKLGDTLTANVGAWSPDAPTPSNEFAYQWYETSSSTKAITGATGQTYTLQSAQEGHTISVKVTATATGYTSITSGYAKATAKVAS